MENGVSDNNNIWPEWQLFYVVGYLIQERRRWPIMTHEDNVLNKFRIWKERHVQMRKPYQSPGSDEKLILLYCPVGDRTHDLPHPVASNMFKVSHGGGKGVVIKKRR